MAPSGWASVQVATLYRTLYVFTVGFHEHAVAVVEGWWKQTRKFPTHVLKFSSVFARRRFLRGRV